MSRRQSRVTITLPADMLEALDEKLAKGDEREGVE
jgi:metal-responsive CopG/Arc/MetJ family transcriptional regulator